MVNMNMELNDIEDVFSDITRRNDGKQWDDINYTDKYNIIICSRVLKKEMENVMKGLDSFAKIPLEYIQGERLRQKQADKYSLGKLIG